MTLTVELTPEVESRLQQMATAEGKPLQEYVRAALEELATPKEVDIHAFLALPREEQDARLRQMAEQVAPLYAADLNRPVAERELTAFTALDGEAFQNCTDEEAAWISKVVETDIRYI